MPVLPRFLLAAAAMSFATVAAATNLKVDYSITLSGLTLGNASFDGTFDDTSYDMKLNGSLTGFAGALSGGSRGGAVAKGVVSGNRLLSAGFSATGQSGSSSRTVQIGVANGSVTAVAIDPPFQYQPDRVPLTEGSTRNIIDPLSGLVTVAPKGAKPDEASNCNRVQPVFDGTQRFNIILNYSGTRLVRKPGFTGNVLVCSIRYVPVAGHRPERASVKFMEKNRDMSVWLAPVEGTRLLIPIRISLETMIGTTVVDAQKWTVAK